MNRRNALKSLALTTAAFSVGKSVMAHPDNQYNMPLKGNINHSVASWTYNFLPLDEMCKLVKKIGFTNIDLVAPKDFAVLRANNINCSMCYTAGKISLTDGWNNPKNHEWLIKDFKEAIPVIASAGYKNLICFSGNRNGMDDMVGMKNCADGLKVIMPLAEQHGIMIQMELFNSKIDHKDYMCDKSSWGVALCKMIASPNFKLLYDIYHMQINEGDVIRTIKENHQYFGHYHTAGVPGRNEIGEQQELNYPAIMKAIVATGYQGYVAQEFIPTGKDNKEKIKALKQAVKICDV
jgi:hydroxypyruvate isomerase